MNGALNEQITHTSAPTPEVPTPQKKQAKRQLPKRSQSSKKTKKLSDIEVSFLGNLELYGAIELSLLGLLYEDQKDFMNIAKRLKRKGLINTASNQKEIQFVKQNQCGREALAKHMGLRLSELQQYRTFQEPDNVSERLILQICNELFLYASLESNDFQLIDVYSFAHCRRGDSGKQLPITQIKTNSITKHFHGVLGFRYGNKTFLCAVIVNTSSKLPVHLTKLKDRALVSLIGQIDISWENKCSLQKFQTIMGVKFAEENCVLMLITYSNQHIMQLSELLRFCDPALQRPILSTTISNIKNGFCANIWTNIDGQSGDLKTLLGVQQNGE